MIPKIIHYCWFGGADKPKLFKKCLASWRKFCPDYEIREWNEDNFDVASCPYVKEAYEAKKWAFVSDYARFKVLYEYGGIYLDTDVELLKNLDGLLSNPFTGFEESDSVATGLIMGCEKGDGLCAEMTEEYEKDAFFIDGKQNLRTVCERVTDDLIRHGLIPNGETQSVFGYTIYAKDYFNPMDRDRGKVVATENTYSIHWYAGTWVSSYDKFRGRVYQLLVRIFGKRFAEALRKAVGRR